MSTKIAEHLLSLSRSLTYLAVVSGAWIGGWEGKENEDFMTWRVDGFFVGRVGGGVLPTRWGVGGGR